MAERLTSGQLAVNGERVRDLGKAIGRGESGLAAVQALVRTIVRERAWQHFIIPETGESVSYAADEFARFVAAPPLAGLGEDPTALRRLCADDAAAVAALDEATQPVLRQGRPNKDNIVMFSPTEQQGNARDYTLRRLKRDAPDLAAMVIAGVLSANAAAIEAGFRKRPTPADQLRTAWRKASAAERAAFLAEVRD